NLPFLRWLVAHPEVRAGRTTTAFLVEHPPLSEPPLRPPPRPWRGAWRPNRPAPPPHSPPDVDAAARDHGPLLTHGEVTAPMAGKVIRVLASPGDHVAARQLLAVLEAMKMETPIAAPYDAVVRSVHVSEGDVVGGGGVLLELEE